MQRFAPLVHLYRKGPSERCQPPQNSMPMKKFLLILIFSLCGGAFLSANVPYFSEPDEPQKPYDAQSFKERFLNLKNDDLETENMVRFCLVTPDFPLYLGTINQDFNFNHYGLSRDYHDAMYQEGWSVKSTSPQIGFMVRRTKRLWIGAEFFYANHKRNVYNVVTSEVVHTKKVNIFTLRPTMQWDAISHEWFRLYLRCGVNAYLTHDKSEGWENDYEAFFGYGYSVGKRLFFFAEGDFGNSFYGCMGIGYRF